LQRARELSKRSVCQANLKGMGTAFYTYGNEYSESWPICPTTPSTVDGTSAVSYVRGPGTPTIGYKRGNQGNPLDGDTTTDTIVSTARNLWTLVRMQISPPKSFNCPSDSASQNNQDQTPQAFWDFGYSKPDGTGTTGEPLAPTDTGYKQCSYGYQVPYTTKGKPSSDRDQRMVLAADRGPYSVLYEGGSPWPTGMPDTGVPTGMTFSNSSDEWKAWNSPNHGGSGLGEGQNVLYAGGSADWQGKPCCGIGYDMIYTKWSSATGAAADARTQGTPPVSKTAVTSPLVAPQSDTDSMIYP